MTSEGRTPSPETCAQGHPMLRCAPPYQDISFCPTCASEVRDLTAPASPPSP